MKELINKLVDKKINHLAEWKNVRYEGARLYWETENIKDELAGFDPEIQVYYLEKLAEQLKSKQIIIQDNTPHSAPEITGQFLDWLESFLIKKKIQNYSVTKKQEPEPENKYLNIFKEGGYELFSYLNEHYTRHDHQLPTKYSNIYRFLEYEQFVICTQDLYKDFIREKFSIEFSKVTKGNFTYESDILPLLSGLKSDFKNQSQPI